MIGEIVYEFLTTRDTEQADETMRQLTIGLAGAACLEEAATP